MTRPDAHQPTLLIRRAGPHDAAALVDLAELDEAPVPLEPLLLAEVAGELWVAVSLVNLEYVADPFRCSAPIADLALARARQLRGEPERAGARVFGRRWPQASGAAPWRRAALRASRR